MLNYNRLNYLVVPYSAIPIKIELNSRCASLYCLKSSFSCYSFVLFVLCVYYNNNINILYIFKYINYINGRILIKFLENVIATYPFLTSHVHTKNNCYLTQFFNFI